MRLVEVKPKNDSYLWKSDLYPAYPRYIGEQIKKHRFDLKMTAIECCKVLAVNKSTLVNWEQGRHKPSQEHLARISWFLGGERPVLDSPSQPAMISSGEPSNDSILIIALDFNIRNSWYCEFFDEASIVN